MPRPFQKGHPKLGGRKRGSLNQKTRLRDFVTSWREFEQTPEFDANWKRRVLAGRGAHLETLGIKLVHPESSAHTITGKLVIEWES